MKRENKTYTQYALVREMLEITEIVKNFAVDAGKPFVEAVKKKGNLFLTGEGSSRIFPAKHTIYENLKRGNDLSIDTEGGTQALEYDLSSHAVFCASNMGRTKEVIRLAEHLFSLNHKELFGLVANPNTKLEAICENTHILSCGKEDAVAATKSVVEQGLFYDSLLHAAAGIAMEGMDELAKKMDTALTLPIDPSITEKCTAAPVIYFAGRNNGVAEELTLKTNEITRKKAAYLEGTYAVHGIEEVMDPKEVVIIIDPFESEEEKFEEVLVKGVGMTVIAVADRETRFPTIQIPGMAKYDPYIQMTAGWNILVEIGIALGIDLDKAERARKVGNEFVQ
jgi:glutamine---fructose-6-phosphate transaminase (isomerizing)